MPPPIQHEQGAPPTSWKIFDLQDFGGLNTRSPRQSIEDNEFAWVENFFPIAPGNLRTLYGKGNPIYTATGGLTIVYHFFYVLNGTAYAFVCLSDGTGIQVNVLTLATTTISAVPGTFYNGTGFPGCTQWGAKYLQIVNNIATSGYFIWDGTALYQAGTVGPVVTITNGGSGYASAPTVLIWGGTGTGATGTATVTNGSVTAISITNAGTGYLVTDPSPQIQISGGGSTSKIARLTATLTAGVITAVTIVDGGAGYLTAPTITVVGGGGSGASITCTVAAGIVNTTTIVNGGTNFTSVPTLVVSGGGNTAATATLVLMPFGVAGTSIENYQNRTWIVNGSRNTFSAPADPANFATSAGGGTYVSNDGFLKSSFMAIKQSSSYLYTIADSSINNISNVSSSGSPITTTFTNINSDAQVGTPWRDSVQSFGLALTIGNSSGFYLMYGGAAQKISEMLDGLFATATLPSTGNGIPGAVATIFGIKILMFLMTVVDPFTGSLTPKLVCYEPERKKWFIASQEVTLTYISTQEFNSVLTAWGTDGLSLFPLFGQSSDTLLKKAKTRLWMGDSWLWNKQVLRAYIQSSDNSGQGAVVTLTVDNENNASSATSILGAGPLNFVNNALGALTFVNNTLGILQFTSVGVSLGYQNIDSQYGNMLGYSFTSTSPDFTIISLAIAYQNYRFLM